MKELFVLLLVSGLGHDQYEVRELSEWGVQQCLSWGFREPSERAAGSADPEVRRRAGSALEQHFNRAFRLCDRAEWPPIEFVRRDCPELRRHQLIATASEWNGWWLYRDEARRREFTRSYAQWLILNGVPPGEVSRTMRDAEDRRKEKESAPDEPSDTAAP